MAGRHYRVFKRRQSAVFQMRVYVPIDIQAFGKPKEIVQSLRETDYARANLRAAELFENHRAEWNTLRQKDGLSFAKPFAPSEAELLNLGWQVFERSRDIAVVKRGSVYSANPANYGEYLQRQVTAQAGLVREIASGNFGRWEKAAAATLAREGFMSGAGEESDITWAGIVAEATVSAIDVENRRDGGELNAQPSSDFLQRARKAREAADAGIVDLPFTKLVKAYMRMWNAAKTNEKETNTEQQKEATYRLFGEFWRDKPIRGVKGKDAAEFRDAVKLLDPNWARSPKARTLHWDDLIVQCGNQEKGLAASTMNRHMRALQSVWDWAEQRGHCEGRNPFGGFSIRLKPGENTLSYRPWENDELAKLFEPPPKRSDLLEVMIVALFTGMRLDEIASMTWGRVRTDGEGDRAITYFDIVDAKTAAGWRQVPVHSQLSWLTQRDRGAADARLWPNFNLEGVGDKAGADAGKMFSDFKIERGFGSRQKTFHSFRKNVTRIIERAGVAENEWAQVFGHERGFTYSVYNPDGITMARKAAIIELVKYPGLTIPHPAK
jgi:integrase